MLSQHTIQQHLYPYETSVTWACFCSTSSKGTPKLINPVEEDESKLTAKMDPFIDLKWKRVVGVPELPLPLSQPELCPQDLLGKHTYPRSTSTANQDIKIFQDDWTKLLSHHHKDRFKELGVDLRTPEDDFETLEFLPPSKTEPVGKFYKGSVKYTLPKGLTQMVQEVPNLQGNHGCIVDGNFLPECDRYDKGIHYIVNRNLGKGGNGTADLCFDSNSQKPFVMKKVKKESLRAGEVLLPVILNHRNVTKFYGLMQKEEQLENGSIKLTMELMIEYGGMALSHFLPSKRNLTPTEIWDLTYQGLDALQHLDYYGIIHHDVKPQNLVVQRTAEGLLLKLTDFGSARRCHEPVESVGWTVEYMAPETCKWVLQKSCHDIQHILMEGQITGRVDVFGFGLVVMYMYKGYHVLQYEITEGKTMYHGFNLLQKHDMHQALIVMLATKEDFVRNLIPDECDPQMKELLNRMTQHNIHDRLTAEQALQVVKERQAQVKLHVPMTSQGPIDHINKPNIRAAHRLQRKPQTPQRVPGKGKSGKRIASKELAPQTPVQEMKMLTMAHQPNNTDVQKLEKTSQVISQATDAIDHQLLDRETAPVSLRQAQGKKSMGRRAMKTEDVPPMRCEPEPEAMDMTECRYEMKAIPNVVSNTEQPREQMVSLANPTQKFLEQMAAWKQQGLVFGNTNIMTGISTEESTTPVVQPVMQAPELTTQAVIPAKPASGNLPYFDLL